MKEMLTYILLLSLAAGCNSKTENKGVNDILQFYGGSLTWSKGFNASTGTGAENGKYFEIELSAPSISQNFNSFEGPASNCAYMFYHALTSQEKKDFSFIRVIIKDSIQESKYVYSIEKLERVEKAVPVLDEAIQNIKEDNIEKFSLSFNPLLGCGPAMKDTLQQLLRTMDSSYGKVKDHMLQGFEFTHLDTAGKSITLVELFATLVRGNNIKGFRIGVDPAVKEHNIYSFRFWK